MTDKKNDEFRVWILGRIRNLLETAAPKERLEELLALTKAMLPDSQERAELLKELQTMMGLNLVPETPTSQAEQPAVPTLAQRLESEMANWEVELTSSVINPMGFLTASGLPPMVLNWSVKAVLPPEFHTAGTRSLTVVLEAQGHSVSAVLEEILRQRKQLREAGVA